MINIRVAREFRRRVREVPSVEKERIFGESNLNAITDGMRVMRTIFSERFGRGRPLAAASAATPTTDRLARSLRHWTDQSNQLAPEAAFGDHEIAIKRAS